MRKPNFFIIGAPKCGTTSMAKWLSEHPNIYMSPIKEPHYFDTDQPIGIKDIALYQDLFAAADDTHHAVGEASVRYLHSKVAVPHILQYNSEAKFIVMVRNPVEMAISLHQEELFNLHEDMDDFEKAWISQSERREGKRIPKTCIDPGLLQYGDYCRIGEQVSRLVGLAGEDKVIVIYLDDVSRDPKGEYDKIIGFLNMDPDDRMEFPVFNSAKKWKAKSLMGLTKFALRMKEFSGIKRHFGIAHKISSWNRIPRKTPDISQEVRHDLYDYFRNDIKILSEVSNRDLSGWMI